MNSISLNIHLLRQAVPVKFSRIDEMQNFYTQCLNKHRSQTQTQQLSLGGSNGNQNLKTLTPNQFICAINLSTNRIVRMTGKVWNQFASDQDVWLVTNQEWQEYCDKVLDQEQLYRHGKKVISKHPTSLSPEKLQHFISQFYDGNRPVDPMRKFTLPPPTANTPLMMMKSLMISGSPTSPLQDNNRRASPARGEMKGRSQSPAKLSPGVNDKALINAVKAALSSSSKVNVKKAPSATVLEKKTTTNLPTSKSGIPASKKALSSSSSISSKRKRQLTANESKRNALKEKIHNSPVHELPPPPPFLLENDHGRLDDEDGSSTYDNISDPTMEGLEDYSDHHTSGHSGLGSFHQSMSRSPDAQERLIDEEEEFEDKTVEESQQLFEDHLVVKETSKIQATSISSSTSSSSSFLPLDPDEYIESSSDFEDEDEEFALHQYYVDLVGSINHGDLQPSQEEVANLAEQMMQQWREQQQQEDEDSNELITDKQHETSGTQQEEAEEEAGIDEGFMNYEYDDSDGSEDVDNYSHSKSSIISPTEPLQKMHLMELLVDDDGLLDFHATLIQQDQLNGQYEQEQDGLEPQLPLSIDEIMNIPNPPEVHEIDGLEGKAEEREEGQEEVHNEEPFEIQQARIFERLNQELLDIIQQDLMKGSNESCQDTESFDGSTIQTFPDDYYGSRGKLDGMDDSSSQQGSRAFYNTNNHVGKLSLTEFSPLSAAMDEREGVSQHDGYIDNTHSNNRIEDRIDENDEELVFNDSFDEADDQMPIQISVDDVDHVDRVASNDETSVLSDEIDINEDSIQDRGPSLELDKPHFVEETSTKESPTQVFHYPQPENDIPPSHDDADVSLTTPRDVAEVLESVIASVISESLLESTSPCDTEQNEVERDSLSIHEPSEDPVSLKIPSEVLDHVVEEEKEDNGSVLGSESEDQEEATDVFVTRLSHSRDESEFSNGSHLSEREELELELEPDRSVEDCYIQQIESLQVTADSHEVIREQDLDSAGNIAEHHELLEAQVLEKQKTSENENEVDDEQEDGEDELKLPSEDGPQSGEESSSVRSIENDSHSAFNALDTEEPLQDVFHADSNSSMEDDLRSDEGGVIHLTMSKSSTTEPDCKSDCIIPETEVSKIASPTDGSGEQDSQRELGTAWNPVEVTHADIGDVSALEDPMAMVVPNSGSLDPENSSANSLSIHGSDAFQGVPGQTRGETIKRSSSSDELRRQLDEKTALLEAVLKEKAALEARLEETRYLLQVFAGVNRSPNPLQLTVSNDPQLMPPNSIPDNGAISSSDRSQSPFAKDFSGSIPVRQPVHISSSAVMRNRRRAWSDETMDSSEAERYNLPQRSAPIRRRSSGSRQSSISHAGLEKKNVSTDPLDGQKSPNSARVAPIIASLGQPDDDESFSTSGSSLHSRSSISSISRKKDKRRLPVESSSQSSVSSIVVRPLPTAQVSTFQRSSGVRQLLNRSSSREEAVEKDPDSGALIQRRDSEMSLDNSLRGESDLITPKYNFITTTSPSASISDSAKMLLLGSSSSASRDNRSKQSGIDAEETGTTPSLPSTPMLLSRSMEEHFLQGNNCTFDESLSADFQEENSVGKSSIHDDFDPDILSESSLTSSHDDPESDQMSLSDTVSHSTFESDKESEAEPSLHSPTLDSLPHYLSPGGYSASSTETPTIHKSTSLMKKIAAMHKKRDTELDIEEELPVCKIPQEILDENEETFREALVNQIDVSQTEATCAEQSHDMVNSDRDSSRDETVSEEMQVFSVDPTPLEQESERNDKVVGVITEIGDSVQSVSPSSNDLHGDIPNDGGLIHIEEEVSQLSVSSVEDHGTPISKQASVSLEHNVSEDSEEIILASLSNSIEIPHNIAVIDKVLELENDLIGSTASLQSNDSKDLEDSHGLINFEEDPIPIDDLYHETVTDADPLVDSVLETQENDLSLSTSSLDSREELSVASGSLVESAGSVDRIILVPTSNEENDALMAPLGSASRDTFSTECNSRASPVLEEADHTEILRVIEDAINLIEASPTDEIENKRDCNELDQSRLSQEEEPTQEQEIINRASDQEGVGVDIDHIFGESRTALDNDIVVTNDNFIQSLLPRQEESDRESDSHQHQDDNSQRELILSFDDNSYSEAIEDVEGDMEQPLLTESAAAELEKRIDENVEFEEPEIVHENEGNSPHSIQPSVVDDIKINVEHSESVIFETETVQFEESEQKQDLDTLTVNEENMLPRDEDHHKEDDDISVVSDLPPPPPNEDLFPVISNNIDHVFESPPPSPPKSEIGNAEQEPSSPIPPPPPLSPPQYISDDDKSIVTKDIVSVPCCETTMLTETGEAHEEIEIIVNTESHPVPEHKTIFESKDANSSVTSTSLQEKVKSPTIDVHLVPPDTSAFGIPIPAQLQPTSIVDENENQGLGAAEGGEGGNEKEVELELLSKSDLPSSAVLTDLSALSGNFHGSLDPLDESLDDIMIDHFGGVSQEITGSDETTLDPYQSLCKYFKPFLIAAKFSENPTIRGYKARRSLIESISDDEILFWIIFQMYGTSDGVMTKHIKTAQIARALKDAKVGNLTPSQLDLLLVKVHAKLAAASVATTKPPSSPASSKLMSPQPTGMTKTGTIVTGSAAKKGLIGGHARADPSTANGAGFPAYLELLNSLAYGLVGESSKSRSSTTPAFTYQKLKEGFLDLLKSRDLSIYNKLYVEYQFYFSGILTKSIYSKLLLTHASGRRMSEWADHAQKLDVSMYTEADLDLVRQIWERNADQIRLIYSFYAGSVETRRIGQGPVKLMLSLENCKEMLQDFEVLPQLIDVQTFYRLFRSCKLWEWDLADNVVRMMAFLSSGANQSFDAGLMADVADNRSIISSVHSQMTGRNSVSPVNEYDPYDIRGTIGNYSLTLYGFVELITRIACFQNKLSTSAHISLENAMHLMDASNGKAKLLRSSRKGVSVRHFVYGDK